VHPSTYCFLLRLPLLFFLPLRSCWVTKRDQLLFVGALLFPRAEHTDAAVALRGGFRGMLPPNECFLCCRAAHTVRSASIIPALTAETAGSHHRTSARIVSRPHRRMCVRGPATKRTGVSAERHYVRSGRRPGFGLRECSEEPSDRRGPSGQAAAPSAVARSSEEPSDRRGPSGQVRHAVRSRSQHERSDVATTGQVLPGAATRFALAGLGCLCRCGRRRRSGA